MMLSTLLPAFREVGGYGLLGALAVLGDELFQLADFGGGFRRGLRAGLLFEAGKGLAGVVDLLDGFQGGEFVQGGLFDGEEATASLFGVLQAFLDFAHCGEGHFQGGAAVYGLAGQAAQLGAELGDLGVQLFLFVADVRQGEAQSGHGLLQL